MLSQSGALAWVVRAHAGLRRREPAQHAPERAEAEGQVGSVKGGDTESRGDGASTPQASAPLAPPPEELPAASPLTPAAGNRVAGFPTPAALLAAGAAGLCSDEKPPAANRA